MKFLIAGYGSILAPHLRNLRELGERDIVLLRSNHSTLPDEEIAGLAVKTTSRWPWRTPRTRDRLNPTALHLMYLPPA